MSADGTPVRSVLDATLAELRELSAYCERLEQELSEANLVAAGDRKYATLCMHTAQAMLLGFQQQDACTQELISYFAGDPTLGPEARRLLANLETARRAGMRRAPVSKPLSQPAAAE